MRKLGMVCLVALFSVTTVSGSGDARPRPRFLPIVDVECGDVITRSLRLKEDVGPCSAIDGSISINAPDVRLDLNGKKVYGSILNAASTGISGSSRAARAIVSNGHVRSFGSFGIHFTTNHVDIVDVLVSDIDTENGDNGVLLEGDGVRVRRVFAKLAADPIRILGDRGSVIDSVIDATSADTGVAVIGDDARVSGVVSFRATEEGVLVEGDRARVLNNRVVSSLDRGIEVVGTAAQVIGNAAHFSSAHGIEVINPGPLRVTVSSNDVHGSAGEAIHVTGSVAGRGNRAYGYEALCEPVALCAASRTLLPVETLDCGEGVIDHSMRLAEDVGPCEDDALVITSPNVVLDLGGHRVFGDDDDPSGDPDVGIEIQPGAAGARVLNGSIEGFDTGLWSRAGTTTVRGVLSADNVTGMNFDGARAVIDDVAVLKGDGVFGILIEGARARLTNSVVRTDNDVNTEAISARGNNATITDNTIFGRHYNPLFVSGTGGVVRRNVVVKGEYGIKAETSGARITDNDVLGAGFYGILADDETGALIARNDVHVTATETAIAADEINVRGSRGNRALQTPNDCEPATLC